MIIELIMESNSDDEQIFKFHNRQLTQVICYRNYFWSLKKIIHDETDAVEFTFGK
jgi:hypothetical protein